MTSIKRLHDYLILVVIALFIFFIGAVIIIKAIPDSYFDYDTYLVEQRNFVNCINDAALFESTQLFHENLISHDLIDIQNKQVSLKEHNTCYAKHSQSSYEQVQDMAKYVLELAKIDFADNVRFVNAVYTAPLPFDALLDRPQTYLFFFMDEDQTKMNGYTVYPTIDGYHATRLWDLDKSDDLEYTQAGVKALLLWYTEIKK